MEMKTCKIQSLRILQQIYHGVKLVTGNAELVLVQSGSDISVGMRVNVGIDPDRNPGPYALPGSKLINHLHLHDGFAVECFNAEVEGGVYLLVRLAYTGINYGIRPESVPGCENHLIAADAIRTYTLRTDILHDTRFHIGLYGIMQADTVFG